MKCSTTEIKAARVASNGRCCIKRPLLFLFLVIGPFFPVLLSSRPKEVKCKNTTVVNQNCLGVEPRPPVYTLATAAFRVAASDSAVDTCPLRLTRSSVYQHTAEQNITTVLLVVRAMLDLEHQMNGLDCIHPRDRTTNTYLHAAVSGASRPALQRRVRCTTLYFSRGSPWKIPMEASEASMEAVEASVEASMNASRGSFRFRLQ